MPCEQDSSMGSLFLFKQKGCVDAVLRDRGIVLTPDGPRPVTNVSTCHSRLPSKHRGSVLLGSTRCRKKERRGR